MLIDQTERDMLHLLQREGRITNVELAQRLGLSETPVFRRRKRLEEDGLVKGYSAELSQALLGLQVTAFVQVSLSKQDERATQSFLDCVADEEHIVECHAMSGSHDYLMKVVATDIDHFSRLCMQEILKYPGVQDIESNFSLKAIKASRALPVNPPTAAG